MLTRFSFVVLIPVLLIISTFSTAELLFSGKYKFVYCVCAKCGSTSHTHWLWETLAGKPFVGDKKLHIQEAIKQRFNLKSIAGMKRLGKAVFTLLIIRDPIERLISSFKSKIACNSTYFKTDYYDRHVLVPQLLNLRGKKDQLHTDVMQMKYEERCLSFNQFLVVLKDIHSMPSKKSRLNQHFLPQDLECLRDSNRKDIDISKSWKTVGNISNISVYHQFFEHLQLHGLESKGAAFVKPKKTHSSKGMLQPTREDLELLVNITRVEYKILGPYLEEPCLYQEEIGGKDLRTRYRRVKYVNQTERSR